MKHALAIVLAVTAVVTAQSPTPQTRTFETDAVGSPPKGFLFPVTRGAAPGKWLVQRESGKPVLAHLPDANGSGGFALAVLDGPRYGDVVVTARMKLAEGERAGGVVWQFQDASNYYMARVDLRKQDVGLFRVGNGNRIRVEHDDDLELEPTDWHTLKVVQKDDRVTVYLNGVRVMKEHDDRIRGAGGVGLWAADAAGIDVDDFRVAQPNE